MEKKYLNCTLITFAMSYGIQVIRDVSNLLLSDYLGDNQMIQIFCDNYDLFNGINLAAYIFIEIIPFLSVAYLNWRNFKKEEVVRSSKNRENKSAVMEHLLTHEILSSSQDAAYNS